MNVIDRNVIGLEQEFVVEALASVIQPEWVTEALVKTDRMSERSTSTPGTVCSLVRCAAGSSPACFVREPAGETTRILVDPG